MINKFKPTTSSYLASRQTESSSTAKQSDQTSLASASRFPTEWKRCSEGFQLTWTGEENKVPAKQCTGLSDAKNSSHSTNNAKAKQYFGQKWIHSEELLQVSSGGKPKTGKRIRDLNLTDPKLDTSLHSGSLEEEDKDSICWNNSESESDEEDTTNVQKTVAQSTKRLKTSISPNNTNQRRKTTKTHLISALSNLPQDCGDDSEDVISASESEEEKSVILKAGNLPPSSICESPVLNIEYIGSPVHSSSSRSSDNSPVNIRDPEKEVEDNADHDFLQTQQGPEGNISSCASSQLTMDSETSPGQSGLRASEWVRQMKWETTPTKPLTATLTDQGDSGKKKKKIAKGGLAEQMSRILQREKSAKRIWQHQHKTNPAFQGAGANIMSVRVKGLEMVYSLCFVRCCIVDNSSSHLPSANARCFVLFSSLSSRNKAALQPGTTVHIYPPWQQADIGAGKVLLCTRYHVSGDTSTASHPVELTTEDGSHNKNTSLSSPPWEGHSRWLCPCSTDVSILAVKCPAHQFPFLPSSLTQHSTITTKHTDVSPTRKLLHTVTCNVRSSQRSLTFNSLLESIEKAPSGDRLLPSFQAMVLRIFNELVDDSNRHCVLVEDSQGTVALITGTGQVSDVEGHLYCFSCLRVNSRTNADRDPALFSAVCGAWCDRVKTAAASQDSDKFTLSNDTGGITQPAMQPPGFCYILEVDRLACDRLIGEDWLTVSTTHTLTTPPPLLITPLAQAMQNQHQNSRFSILAKFLYLSKNSSHKNERENNNPKAQSALYITDHSLQKDHTIDGDCMVTQGEGQVYSENHGSRDARSLPAYVKIEVQSDCVSSATDTQDQGIQNSPCCIMLLRDIWLVNGSWIADKYSSVLPCEPRSEKNEALRARIDPEVYKAVSECRPRLPVLSATSLSHDLVSVSGVITGVDEKTAVSWEECDGCGSDQLSTKTGSGSLTCLRCRKDIACAVQRMRMEVTVVSNTHPPVSVNVTLQQSTIEELLPDEEDEEGYDVECVLDRSVGPINCVITSVTSGDAAGVTTFAALQLPS